MKKAALLLSVVLTIGVLFGVTKVYAQDSTTGVLAATTTRKPTPLPRILTGQKISFGESVNQDLVGAGGNLDVNSNVNGNLVLAGGQIKVSGSVSEDLVVAGGQIELSGEIKKNVIVAGGMVKVGQRAHISGYLLAVGGQVELLGRIDGDTRVFGGEVTIGDKSAFGGSLTIDASKITSPNRLMVAGEKHLTEIRSNGKMPWGYWRNIMPQVGDSRVFTGVFALVKVIEFVGKILLMLVLVKVWGKRMEELTKYVKANFWSSLGWGSLKLFLTPFLIIVLLMSVFGIPLAILTAGVYFGSIFLSIYLSSAVLGHYLTMRGWLTNSNPYVQGVVGLLLLELVGLVPVIGWIIKFAAMLIGLGLVIRWEKSLVGLKG